MLGYQTQCAVTFWLIVHTFSTLRWTVDSTGDDLIVGYHGNNISTIALIRRLNITGNFRFGALCPKDEHSCKTRCPHGVVHDPAERKKKLPCYCDSQCLDIGDCCYDFLSSCPQVQHHGNQHRQWECVNMNNSGTHGYVMNTKCPPRNVQSRIQTLCETTNNTDFLRGIPVVDEQTGLVYRNVFCARCNSVRSVSYWRMNADCGRIPASALPQDNALLLAFIRENCTVTYKPTVEQQTSLKHCVAAESSCSVKQVIDKEPVLQGLCSYYSFPVCSSAYKNPHCRLCNGEDITQYNCGCLNTATTNPPMHTTKEGSAIPPHTTNLGGTTSRPTMNSNTASSRHTTDPGTRPPHSTNSGTPQPPPSSDPGRTTPPPATPPPLQATPPPPLQTTPPIMPPGTVPIPYTTFPWTTPPPHITTLGYKPTSEQKPFTPQPPPPPLSILFDFSSDSNKISIQGTTTETKVVKLMTCEDGFLYDPFVGLCREAFRKVIVNTNSSANSTNSTYDNFIMLNCSGIQLNFSDTVLYPNGTLWVPLYLTGYNRTEYFMNGSLVFLCTDFASNYSKRETVTKWSYVVNVTPLQILTYVGCSVSVLSLLILLVIYCILKELRNLPGKNLINLSLSMIFYHIFLFVAGFRNIQELCTGIAFLLHYFLLCSFAWMSIMAFDVAKTFVFRDTALRSEQGRQRRKTFLKYCVCAWGLPATAVLTCFLLDYTDTINIGYGRGGFCWVKNGTALLFVVGVPVALVILFNFVALTWTVVAIYKVRKVTDKLEDQRGHSSLALLYIKLTCVLGLTWVLGFLSSIVKAEATTYLFVIVNSLQGFFIFLAFVAKKRTIALLRGPRKNHHESGQSIDNLDTKL